MDISILLIDDDIHLAEIYQKFLEAYSSKHKLGLRVTTSTDAEAALGLAKNQLFDVLVIDAKLYYKGVNHYGGLLLADDLLTRYGANSILIISRYITKDEISVHKGKYDFLGKTDSANGNAFVNSLVKKVIQMKEKQFAFVAMPFSDNFKCLKDSIIDGVVKGGIQCFRADDILHNKAAANKTLELIRNSKLVVFLADGGNANAYYEAGYAHALDKEVMIIARAKTELLFDVAYLNCFIYNDNSNDISNAVKLRLLNLRLKRPVGM